MDFYKMFNKISLYKSDHFEIEDLRGERIN